MGKAPRTRARLARVTRGGMLLKDPQRSSNEKRQKILNGGIRIRVARQVQKIVVRINDFIRLLLSPFLPSMSACSEHEWLRLYASRNSANIISEQNSYSVCFLTPNQTWVVRKQTTDIRFSLRLVESLSAKVWRKSCIKARTSLMRELMRGICPSID